MVLHIKDDGLGNKRILTEKEFQNEKSAESLNGLAGAFSIITVPVGIIAGICMFIYMMYSGFGDMNNTFEVVFYTFISLIVALIVGVAAYTFMIPFAAVVLLGIIFTVSDKLFFDKKKSSVIEKSIYKNNPNVSNSFFDSSKSYRELRSEIISSEWLIYKRDNPIKGWDKNRPYPELDFCLEDYCEASFISVDGSKVRQIGFGYCSTDRYIQCPNKPNGFEVVKNDAVISKSESDNKFLKMKFKIED
jgi:hypothetical protein